ncbi:MAG: DUF6691 family protein [Maricaulaceae bacterium]
MTGLFRAVAAGLSGLIFGLGLVVSGMINPAKVLNFLDIAGTWDPSLMFVMGGGLLVTAPALRWLGGSKPWFDSQTHWPGATAIDAKLLGGAALFGVGWGLVGYCPGPAIAALGAKPWPTLVFIAAMIGGMRLVDLIPRLARPKAQAA